MKVNFDQFYTKISISDELVKRMMSIIFNKRERERERANFLEPAGGEGSFIRSLLKNNISRAKISSYDIEPGHNHITKGDYLKKELTYDNERITIGNPPFGKRGKLALEFLNKALTEAPYVAFILPNIFNRYSIQKQINPQAKLIYTKQLPADAFYTKKSKKYTVKCVFQIWTTNSATKNLRITTPLPIRHPDFTTYIHNNTQQTLKYFDQKKYQWDFAVYRQGFYNYQKKFTSRRELKTNRQYFFVKAKNKDVLAIIKKINFTKLSLSNTQVCGFSTTDVVRAYIILKKQSLKC